MPGIAAARDRLHLSEPVSISRVTPVAPVHALSVRADRCVCAVCSMRAEKNRRAGRALIAGIVAGNRTDRDKGVAKCISETLRLDEDEQHENLSRIALAQFLVFIVF